MVTKVCGSLEMEVIFTPLFYSLPEEEVIQVLTENLVIAYEELLKMYKEEKQK